MNNKDKEQMMKTKLEVSSRLLESGLQIPSHAKKEVEGFITNSSLYKELCKLQSVILKAKTKIDKFLEKNGLEFTSTRIKEPINILKKMLLYGIEHPFLINDVIGYKCIEDSPDKCYQKMDCLLSIGFIPFEKILDTLYQPVPEYGDHRSLDLALFNKFGFCEFQIRTIELEEAYNKTYDQYKKIQEIMLYSKIMKNNKIKPKKHLDQSYERIKKINGVNLLGIRQSLSGKIDTSSFFTLVVSERSKNILNKYGFLKAKG